MMTVYNFNYVLGQIGATIIYPHKDVAKGVKGASRVHVTPPWYENWIIYKNTTSCYAPKF